jgi:hypothetical protein
MLLVFLPQQRQWARLLFWGCLETRCCLKDPSSVHVDLEKVLEWAGGWFDPEEFDPMTATKSRKKGLSAPSLASG